MADGICRRSLNYAEVMNNMGALTRAERRRQEKALAQKPVYYQYTASQIEMMKRQAVKAEEDRIRERIKADVDRHIVEEGEHREELLSGDGEHERILKVLSLLMSVPARILVDKFHWLPVRDENDRRSKLLQFSEAVVAEVNRICGDEKADIERYAAETYEICGVKYTVEDDGKDGENNDETEK